MGEKRRADKTEIRNYDWPLNVGGVMVTCPGCKREIPWTSEYGETCQECSALAAAARALGARGGRAGTGKSKVRGGPDYYRRINPRTKPK